MKWFKVFIILEKLKFWFKTLLEYMCDILCQCKENDWIMARKNVYVKENISESWKQNWYNIVEKEFQ